MRRLLIVLAGLAVLVGGALAAFVIHRLQESGDIRGSASVEYVTTERQAAPPSPKTPWPTYGFDAQRTRSVQLGLRPPFVRVWRYHAGSLVEFPPAIGYHRLFFSTNSGAFTAISERTGKRAWRRLMHRCVAASPALGPHSHGTVYAVFLNRPPCNATSGGHGRSGEVVAFSSGHGKVRWSRTIGPSESSPLLLGHRLYVGDWNGDVWALDANNGRVLWRTHTGAAIKGALASSGGRLYIGNYAGRLYCLAARDGHVIWRAKSQPRLYGGSQFYSTPAIAYGRVYIGSTDHRVYSYGATSGKIRWSHATGSYVYASPAVWNQRVLVGSYDGTFYALDAPTGKLLWRFRANGPISGSATVIDGVVYFATLKQRTYALDARTGKQLWTFPDGKYTPAVAVKGHLFLIGYGIVYGMVPRR
jgi:outer membrane protein assembly factor BamB